VLALVASSVAGCQLGWKRTLSEIHDSAALMVLFVHIPVPLFGQFIMSMAGVLAMHIYFQLCF
jgi:hypothetical protein